MLQHCLLDVLVDGEQRFAGSPVPANLIVSVRSPSNGCTKREFSHLADELTSEGVDDTGDRWRLALAYEIEVEHSLDSARL